jgi:hypothetical protein
MTTPHGECLISVEDNIIYIQPIGAFNEEGIIEASKEVSIAVDNFGDENFKLLLDYTSIEGATPEAFVKLNEFNSWLNTQNMVAKAVVVNLSLTLTLLNNFVPERSIQNDKNFDNKADAIEWIKRQ